MKIGLFGGSFNPLHNGHLSKIKKVLDRGLVDEVWIIPCKTHPFDKKIESAIHRLKMMQIVLRGNNKIKINDVELKSRGKSFTFNTIKKLKQKYNHDFCLMIGEDILPELKDWNSIDKIFQEVKFIILPRNKNDVSSTKIRRRVREGERLSDLVDRNVEKYIYEEGLYK